MRAVIEPGDLIGNAQVRELLGGITRNTLIAWRRDRQFPAPVATIDRTEIWDRRAVDAWKKENRDTLRAAKKIARGRKRGRKGT